MIVMKLTKGETNELLLRVSEDNFKYGCIFKLIYVYAKDGKRVLSLKWDDIDFENDTICFKNTMFPLHHQIRDDLLKLDRVSEYVFLDCSDVGVDRDNCVDVFRKKLRYYLSNTVKDLDVCFRIKRESLSITDLRRLRGQHLVLDGVPLKVVMQLYLQSINSLTQFKKYLEYDDLYMELYPCGSVEGMFRDYTDLGVFEFDSHTVKKDYFMVSNRSGDSLVICISDDGDGLSVVNEDDDLVSSVLVDEVYRLYYEELLCGLGVLRAYEFKSVDGLSFVKM